MANTTNQRTNAAGIAIIKEFEGLRLESYLCPAGVWTVGYGTTKGVRPNVCISEEKAEQLLREDLASFEAGVNKMLAGVPLSNNQFSALVSLCYNCGLAPIKQGNTIRRTLEAGDYNGAADGFLLWRKAGGRVLEGLVRRRKRERELFLSGGSAAVAPASMPDLSEAQGGSSTRIIVKVTQDTFLKASLKQQVELTDSEKKFLKANMLMAGELRSKDAGHFRVWLEEDSKDEEWYLYEGHVEILNVVAIQ
ncbi:MAG: lysozyme [Elainellaceae cyanobacterium]